MKAAFLFPGQGSIFQGMGKDIFAEWPAAREVYERASRLTGKNIAALSFNASRSQLTQTANAHLAVFVFSLAVDAVLKDYGVEPSFVSGHSLGQFAAVTAAGSLTFEDGLRLVEQRGALLAESCARQPGCMIAVRGCSKPDVDAVVGSIPAGVLCIAGLNGRDEIVVSGDLASLKTAMSKLRERGGTIFPLNVSGAFHSQIVTDAASAFAAAVERFEFRNPRWPVVSTRSGWLLTSADDVQRDLVGHMLQPVRWDLVLETLFGRSVDGWIEVGPGKVLTGLVLRWDRKARCFPTSSSAAIRKLLSETESAARTE